MQKPNYTQTPNEIIDKHLRELTGSEVKILFVVTRKTIGYHKDVDSVSSAQIMETTGLSKDAVFKGIKSLEARGLLIVDRQGAGKVNRYTLNLSDDGEREGETVPKRSPHLGESERGSIVSENKTPPYSETGPEGVRKSDRSTERVSENKTGGCTKIGQEPVRKTDTYVSENRTHKRKTLNKQIKLKEKGEGTSADAESSCEPTETSLASPLTDLERTESKPKTREEVYQLFEDRRVEKNYDYDYDEETDKFLAHYENVGWCVGKRKMKNWRLAVVGWASRSAHYSRGTPVKRKLTQSQEKALEGIVW